MLKILFRGKLVEELSRDELIEAVHAISAERLEWEKSANYWQHKYRVSRIITGRFCADD